MQKRSAWRVFSFLVALMLMAGVGGVPVYGQATQPAEAIPEHDEGLAKALVEGKIAHRMLKNGDFLLPFRMEEGDTKVLPVVVTSKQTRLGERRLRSVFTTLMRTDGMVDQELANRLLAMNTVLPLGGWAVQRSERGQTLVLFKVQVDAEAPVTQVYDLSRYAAAITYRQRKAMDAAGIVPGSATQGAATQPAGEVEDAVNR